MLRIFGPATGGYCDHVSRRSFLYAGGILGLAGTAHVSLADVLRGEQQPIASPPGSSSATAAKISASASGAVSPATSGDVAPSVIMVFLPGGPPHQDMFDLKPYAPREIRGEFRSIATNVPGIHICEHLPRLAQRMDKLVLVRSLVGAKDRHESFQCMTGHLRDRQPPGGYPELGSIVAKWAASGEASLGPSLRQTSGTAAVPSYVGLSPKMQHHPYNSGYPGCLGPAYAPFQPHGGGQDDLVLHDMSLDRLEDRKSLLRAVDQFRRDAERQAALRGMDSYQQQAFGILTSSRLAEALDVSREPESVRARYGSGTTQVQGDAAPRDNQQFLVARRLVEAGARCVTLSYSFWDWHGQNFHHGRQNLPDLDMALSALIDDLYARELADRVTVIVWGEFGRTPRVNNSGGRDHWPRVSCALLAGGGLRTGQVLGATDRLAGEPVDRPVHFQEIHATIYHTLGIDPHHTTYTDLAGRPQYLVDAPYAAISEII